MGRSGSFRIDSEYIERPARLEVHDAAKPEHVRVAGLAGSRDSQHIRHRPRIVGPGSAKKGPSQASKLLNRKLPISRYGSVYKVSCADGWQNT
jgi:hypothetical protein